MKKITISKLFLYKKRFIIGYILLGLAFIGLLFALPFIAQKGLTEAEMQSAITSYNIEPDAVFSGNLVDLPYHLLQKLSIRLLGLTPFAIKLPSIIIGLLLGLMLILVLNRWFKNNVSLLASVLMILTTPFLFLAGSGTPLIMLVFWPILLLWIGSKIQGEKRPEPIFCFLFAFMLFLSIFTPYMCYFALFCVIFVLTQPHLRFVIKQLPKIPLSIVGAVILVGISILIVNAFNNPSATLDLIFANNFETSQYFNNISTAFGYILSWNHGIESIFLTPLISLPIFAIALVGLFSTTKGFFASRNSIATLLIIFSIFISGFRPDAIIFIIFPVSILVAHGLKYILEKWYGLFPENPYARIFALIPLSIMFGLIIIPGLFQYINGYRYNPNVANNFNNNLSIIRKNLTNETIIIEKDTTEYNFYRILEESTNLKISSEITEDISGDIAILGKPENAPEKYQLSRIITSEKSDNSDIIYLYTAKEGE
ncbi:MAG: glycosyltransferase family 39 protein [Candidatus Saccharibacteria bacterium]|nr:glycosyltransferase family 39 protein [Candidatus Saccharibacteria bacterium]